MSKALRSAGVVAPGVYHIAFDGRATPGYLQACKVTIEMDMLPSEGRLPKDQQERYNIALADHPLYADLHQYCMANPPRKT